MALECYFVHSSEWAQFDVTLLVGKVAVAAQTEAAVGWLVRLAHSAPLYAAFLVMTALVPVMAAARSQVLVESDAAVVAKTVDLQSAVSVAYTAV